MAEVFVLIGVLCFVTFCVLCLLIIPWEGAVLLNLFLGSIVMPIVAIYWRGQ